MADLPDVKLDNFEGPFDLLLELARNKKIDLTRVSLREITDNFLTYISQNEISASLRADFLLVAATLLLLKINQLLPELTEEEEEEVVELTDRVLIYQQYREQGMRIMDEWKKKILFFGPERFVVQDNEMRYSNQTVDDLCSAMDLVIGKIKTPVNKRRHLRPAGKSLKECIEILTARLNRFKKIIFNEVFAKTDNQTKATSFLAMLELAKRQEVSIFQKGSFSSIMIKSNNGANITKN